MIPNILGPSWIPRIGAIIAIVGGAMVITPSDKLKAWSPAVIALGSGLIGYGSRQFNVSSEKQGLKTDEQETKT